MVTFYELLGVRPSADLGEIRTAFKRRALLLHPDKGGTKESFQKALLAFETLSDSGARAKYDARLAAKVQAHSSQAAAARGAAEKRAARERRPRRDEPEPASAACRSGRATAAQAGEPQSSASSCKARKAEAAPAETSASHPEVPPQDAEAERKPPPAEPEAPSSFPDASQTKARGESGESRQHRLLRRLHRLLGKLTKERLTITSRNVADLSLALEYLVILMAIKSAAAEAQGSFQDRLRFAVPQALHESGATAESMGLGYYLCVCSAWLLGRSFPMPKLSTLEQALRAWAMLGPFILRSGQRSLATKSTFLDRADEDWARLRHSLLQLVAETGNSTEAWAARLDGLHRAAAPKRQRVLEEWNAFAMAAEERRQRQAAMAAKRGERLERRAMAWEDRRARAFRRPRHAPEPKAERRQRSLELTVGRLLELWSSGAWAGPGPRSAPPGSGGRSTWRRGAGP